METADSYSRLLIAPLVTFLALMSSCCLPFHFVFLPIVFIIYFRIDFLHMVFFASSVTLEAIMSLQLLFMQVFFLFGGKIDRIPLVLSFKGGRVWSVYHIPHPDFFYRRDIGLMMMMMMMTNDD